MENKKLGQEPAYPQPDTYHCQGGANGISKRFYAACAAMQGLLAANRSETHSLSFIIKLSYIFADELLKQENEGL